MNSRLSLRFVLFAALSLLILASCGGGGSEGDAPPRLDLDLNMDYRALSDAEREALTGLDAAERAALKLFKTQVLAAGVNNGGIYFNVLNDPDDFSAGEVGLVRLLYNEEMAEYGSVTGKALDARFFDVALKITGTEIPSRYADAPALVANGPLNLGNIVSGSNGLGGLDNAVLRLWPHDLLDNGKMDGSVTKFTLLSPFALDAVDGSPGSLELEAVKVLLAADLATGTPDGTPLRLAMGDVLEAVYFGGPGTSIAKVLAEAGIDQAQANALFDEWAKRRGYAP